ncbi:DUF3822 family protein [Lutibacter sp. TH_r2]|uniref:DUF3822 family protein n=1 Tax=Lutibacter sp. TH_r2 TaxID=3082083 RepID=UPI002953AAC0|nr:DUF3822 family protein [Lutibacter sp. TH_r2]MDV7188428.1 DUF3822 family protein [Lutibacter sp. TH_r2]
MIKEIKKINNTIDLKNLNENSLSIQISLDGFSFCIYNSYEKEIVALSSYELEYDTTITPEQHLVFIKDVFEKETILKSNFKSVLVTHYNNLITQVPKPFLDKDNLESYLKYSVKLLENDYVTFDEIENSDIVNVYIPFVNINNFLIDIYGTFVFKHSSTRLIETILVNYKNNDKDYMFINVLNNTFELVILKNTKFQLYNQFSFKTKEDFIYYLLFTAEQLELNPEEFELKLSGEIEKESELYTVCYQYIRNISFLEVKNFPSLLNNELSKHSYYTLLSQL